MHRCESGWSRESWRHTLTYHQVALKGTASACRFFLKPGSHYGRWRGQGQLMGSKVPWLRLGTLWHLLHCLCVPQFGNHPGQDSSGGCVGVSPPAHQLPWGSHTVNIPAVNKWKRDVCHTADKQPTTRSTTADRPQHSQHAGSNNVACSAEVVTINPHKMRM